MLNPLRNKKIILGVTGSIAAYKSAELVRCLHNAGADLRVVMTKASHKFITPLTLQGLSGYPVRDDLFSESAESGMGHIELARWANIILIAPASANIMGRLAHGHANDLLTTLCLATQAPIILAPAMNEQMWNHALTQKNKNILLKSGIVLFGPANGEQACGERGFGRLLEPVDIINKLATYIHEHEEAITFEKRRSVFLRRSSYQRFSGKKILITAGATQEPWDPVRFISNHSTGKMGYALAEAFQTSGACVTLISGISALPSPKGVQCILKTTTKSMHRAVMHCLQEESYDLFIANAACGDYRPAHYSTQKIKKSDKKISLTLLKNPDILASVGLLKRPPFIVGFAAETKNLLEQATQKLHEKNADMIVANLIKKDNGFKSDVNKVSIVSKEKNAIHLPKMSKIQLAYQLVDMIADRISSVTIRPDPHKG